MSGTQKRALIDEIRKFFGDCGLDFLDVSRLKTNVDYVILAEEIPECLCRCCSAKSGA